MRDIRITKADGKAIKVDEVEARSLLANLQHVLQSGEEGFWLGIGVTITAWEQDTKTEAEREAMWHK